MSVVGRWRIVDMELWNKDAIDLVAPGFIEFQPDTTGSFGFIAVQGCLDWREAPHEGRPGAEFSWEGFDEGDPASGCGWATLDLTAVCVVTCTSTWATTPASTRLGLPKTGAA